MQSNGGEGNREREEIEAFEEKQRKELLEFQERQRRELEAFQRQECEELHKLEERLEGEHHEVQIKIDRNEFRVKERFLTGAQLRALPNPPIGPDRDLFEVVPGGPDRKIELEQEVHMHNGLRFFSAPAQINPGTGG